MTTGGSDDTFETLGLGYGDLPAEGSDAVVPAAGFVPSRSPWWVEGFYQAVRGKPGKHAVERTNLEADTSRLTFDGLREAIRMPRCFSKAQQDLEVV